MKDRRQEITNIYKRVMEIVFVRLSPTFGQRTIAAIAKNALVRQGKKHPMLAYVKVAESSVDWSAFESHLSEIDEDQLAASLEVFFDEFFDSLSNLIGRLVVGKIFKEAEEAAKRGDEE